MKTREGLASNWQVPMVEAVLKNCLAAVALGSLDVQIGETLLTRENLEAAFDERIKAVRDQLGPGPIKWAEEALRRELLAPRQYVRALLARNRDRNFGSNRRLGREFNIVLRYVEIAPAPAELLVERCRAVLRMPRAPGLV